MTSEAAIPRVAVIVPCHDDGELVREAVASIQESEPVEIVVVDDASTDPSTRSALKELSAARVRVCRHDRNRGPAAARTTGLAHTSAPYVFPLDADDLMLPGSLGAMADRLDAASGAAACVGDYEEFGVHTAVRSVPERLDPYRIAYHNDFGAALFRRDFLESAGGWDPQGLGAEVWEDWNLWMTLAERGGSCVHAGDRITYRRRIHAGRRLAAERRRQRTLYANQRRLHPRLFGDIRRHRARSTLGPVHKALYPLVHGGRPRLRFEPRLRIWLHRLRLRRLDR